MRSRWEKQVKNSVCGVGYSMIYCERPFEGVGVKHSDCVLKVFLLRLGVGGVGKFFTFFKKCV